MGQVRLEAVGSKVTEITRAQSAARGPEMGARDGCGVSGAGTGGWRDEILAAFRVREPARVGGRLGVRLMEPRAGLEVMRMF
jgi:hypothetical protein